MSDISKIWLELCDWFTLLTRKLDICSIDFR